MINDKPKYVRLDLQPFRTILDSMTDQQIASAMRAVLDYCESDRQVVPNRGDESALAFNLLKDGINEGWTVWEANMTRGQKMRDSKKCHNTVTDMSQVYDSDVTELSQRQILNIKEENKKEEKEEKEKERNSLTRVMLSSTDNAVDLNGLANYWNSQLDANNGIMSKVKSIGGTRKNSVLARVKEYGKEAVKTAIEKAAASQFLNGKNDKGWVASFDWIFMHPNNFIKVLEGNYDTKIIGTATESSTKQYQSASERVDAILGLRNNSE